MQYNIVVFYAPFLGAIARLSVAVLASCCLLRSERTFRRSGEGGPKRLLDAQEGRLLGQAPQKQADMPQWAESQCSMLERTPRESVWTQPPAGHQVGGV